MGEQEKEGCLIGETTREIRRRLRDPVHETQSSVYTVGGAIDDRNVDVGRL